MMPHVDERSVADFYDEPGMQWSLRNVGPHLHPGGEEATAALAARAAAAGLARGGLIVDVASALGAPARFIARRFTTRVVCIDMDPRMHTAASAANRQEALARVVQPSSPGRSSSRSPTPRCDGAWSQDALCHMDKEAVLSEVARVLKDGALFAFTDFIARRSITADDLAALRREWAFPSLFTVPRYVSALDSLGFEVLLAEDRTAAVAELRTRPSADDEQWWRDFATRWGEAEANARRATGALWQKLLERGSAGYAMFIARKTS